MKRILLLTLLGTVITSSPACMTRRVARMEKPLMNLTIAVQGALAYAPNKASLSAKEALEFAYQRNPELEKTFRKHSVHVRRDGKEVVLLVCSPDGKFALFEDASWTDRLDRQWYKLVPLDDTAQFGPQYAVAVTDDGNLVGVAGYERYGADILLRSVAVSESWRSTGIGARLTTDRLAHAKSQGCEAAYLLTDTARGYWERHGFSKIDRQVAPAAVTRSHEWSAACPVSATAMFRSLRED